MSVNSVDKFCCELKASVTLAIDQPASRRKVSQTVFYLVAILFVVVFPLAVPVAVSAVHAIGNWKQRIGAGRRAGVRTVPAVLAPASQGAVAAAA
jgi:hypothetical protein